MSARYVFAVRFRVEPERDVSIEPDAFETRLYRPADPPGEPGWLFFRDNLWRGDASDPEHLRSLASEALGVTVLDVDYRAFETDPEHYEALREAIAEDLDLFRADDVPEVVTKYFGGSIEVREPE